MDSSESFFDEISEIVSDSGKRKKNFPDTGNKKLKQTGLKSKFNEYF